MEDLPPEASEAAEEAEAKADLPIQVTAQAQNGTPDALTSMASALKNAANQRLRQQCRS